MLSMACKTLSQLASAFFSRLFLHLSPPHPLTFMVQTSRLSFRSVMGQSPPSEWKQIHNRLQFQIISEDAEISLIKLWLPVITQTPEISN